jgi:hypothetical protein
MESLPKTRVFVFDTTMQSVQTYATLEEAIGQTPGLDVAEGGVLFFAANGSPLVPVFSEPARMNHDTNTYTNGVYSLTPGSGRTLQDVLFG